MSIFEIKDICMSFGGLQALIKLNLTLEPGEIKGLIGPNGAGKSTVFNIITGIYPQDSGSIQFLGQNLDRFKSHQRASMGISRTFQNLQLFTDMTVLENILTGLHNIYTESLTTYLFRSKKTKATEKKARERAEELLQMVEMEAFAEWPVSELSFAQQRLVEIARALAPEPKLLLLDEPASGIDPKMHEGLKKILKKIREEKGVTIIHIEHIMSMVMDIADRVMVLNNGSALFEGTPAEVRENPKVQEVYLGA
jgi:ABC-type branched-subunit amino acid transport system ATPase component